MRKFVVFLLLDIGLSLQANALTFEIPPCTYYISFYINLNLNLNQSIIHRLVEDYPGHLVTSLHRGSPLFCHDCFLYVGVIVTEPKDLLYFSVDFKVDRDIIYLENDKMVTGVVEPDTHSQYFIIDLRSQEYDTDLYIGIQKMNELDSPVVLDVSKTVRNEMEAECE